MLGKHGGFAVNTQRSVESVGAAVRLTRFFDHPSACPCLPPRRPQPENRGASASCGHPDRKRNLTPSRAALWMLIYCNMLPCKY